MLGLYYMIRLSLITKDLDKEVVDWGVGLKIVSF